MRWRATNTDARKARIQQAEAHSPPQPLLRQSWSSKCAGLHPTETGRTMRFSPRCARKILMRSSGWFSTEHWQCQDQQEKHCSWRWCNHRVVTWNEKQCSVPMNDFLWPGSFVGTGDISTWPLDLGKSPTVVIPILVPLLETTSGGAASRPWETHRSHSCPFLFAHEDMQPRTGGLASGWPCLGLSSGSCSRLDPV